MVATDSVRLLPEILKAFQYPQRAGCGCNRLMSVTSSKSLRCFSTLNGLDVVATYIRVYRLNERGFQYPQRAGCGCNSGAARLVLLLVVSVPSTGWMWLQQYQCPRSRFRYAVSVPSTGWMWLQHYGLRQITVENTVSVPSTGWMWLQRSVSDGVLSASCCFSTLNGLDVVATRS